jgi:pyruvate dehydrogenase E1 component alpha subunit
MDIIAVHQAIKHARQWALDGKGPMVLEFVTYRYGGHSYVLVYPPTSSLIYLPEYRMSDPGTTYRTRDEVQRMRSTQDPIRGLQSYIEQWGLATEEDLKVSRRGPAIRLIMLTSLVLENG